MRRALTVAAAVVLAVAALAVLVPAPGAHEDLVRLPAVPGAGAGPAKGGGITNIRPATPGQR